MRVFIAADMEGATGVVHGDQLLPGKPGYGAARSLLTRDVNAAIEGVLDADADASFVVGDGHGVMRNVVLEELHASAELVIGPASVENKPLCQLEGIDHGFDMLFCVGYHSKAGFGGTLSHTFVGSLISELRLGGRAVGEVTANAHVAGAFGVPLGLVVGNDDLERELGEDLPGERPFVWTKRSLGPTAAVCRVPSLTTRLIREGARQAVRSLRDGKLPVSGDGGAVEFEVEFYRRESAARASEASGVQRSGDRTVSASGARADEAFATMWRGVCRALDETPSWLS